MKYIFKMMFVAVPLAFAASPSLASPAPSLNVERPEKIQVGGTLKLAESTHSRASRNSHDRRGSVRGSGERRAGGGSGSCAGNSTNKHKRSTAFCHSARSSFSH